MTAIISQDGRYRYALGRDIDRSKDDKPVLFIMLNPSTADATKDDPTIRRCRFFAKKWGANGLVVANLYAFRTTNPKDLWKQDDPVGPENDRHIQMLAEACGAVVCAWGANAAPGRVIQVGHILRQLYKHPMCLGMTEKTKQPRHPLYVHSKTVLVPYNPLAARSQT